jgi:hypothetical protein
VIYGVTGGVISGVISDLTSNAIKQCHPETQRSWVEGPYDR